MLHKLKTVGKKLKSLTLGHLPFFVHINGLPENFEFDVKLFADETSLFSTADNPVLSIDIMNNDLIKISECA